MDDVRAQYYDGTKTILKTSECVTYMPIWAAWDDYYRQNNLKPPQEEVFTKTEFPPNRKDLQEILDRNKPFEKITDYTEKIPTSTAKQD